MYKGAPCDSLLIVFLGKALVQQVGHIIRKSKYPLKQLQIYENHLTF